MKLQAMVATSLDSVIKKKRGEAKKGPGKGPAKKGQPNKPKTQKSNKSKTITRQIQLTPAQLA